MTCYRRKSTVWPGKLISSKKTPKNSVFWRQEIGITSLWEDLEAKLLTPGQLLGYPWKVWGITVQTSYWEGQWHHNCWYTSSILFFEAAREISEKRNFFVNCSVPENFRWENFGHTPRKSLHTQNSGKKLKHFWPCFGRPKLGECDKMQSVSKNMSH